MNICINVPSIVYQNVFSGETGNLSSVSIYTPSGPGLFRVTATIYVTGSAGALISVSGTITGGNGDTQTAFAGSIVSATQGSVTGTQVYTGYSTIPFLLSTSMTVSSGIGQYDVYITIEQLQ